MRRLVLVGAGSFFLAVGGVGIVVPGLPTTPLFILSAACYARSSERCYRWLVGNRLFGRYLDDYLRGRGIPWRVRVVTLAILWVGMGCTALFAVEALWLRVLLIAIAAGVTVHIVLLKRRGDRTPEGRGPDDPASGAGGPGTQTPGTG
jgi:uncharacterized membrane protein YbaN (DUF454 family)